MVLMGSQGHNRCCFDPQVKSLTNDSRLGLGWFEWIVVVDRRNLY